MSSIASSENIFDMGMALRESMLSTACERASSAVFRETCGESCAIYLPSRKATRGKSAGEEMLVLV